MIIPMSFMGMRWQLPEVSQGAQYATTAHNMYRINSALEPLRSGAKSTDLPSADFLFARKFFLHDDQFVASEQDTDFATTQVVGDKARRLYYVENGILQFLPRNEIPANYPTPTINGHRSGIEAPPFNMSDHRGAQIDDLRYGILANSLISSTDENGNSVFRYENLIPDERLLYFETVFVYTYVNRFGEESAPSPASNVVYVRDSSEVTLTRFSHSTNPDVVAVRIYMLIDGEFFHVPYADDTIPATANSVEITNFALRNDTTGGEITHVPYYTENRRGIQLVSVGWEQAPAGLEHMASLDNGILAVADDHNIYLSEPYTWHAFPTINTYTVIGKIKKLGNVGGGLAVMTDRGTEFFFGSDPGAMFQSTVTFPYSIRDPESFMQFENSGIYVCDDGIAMISSEGGQIVTDGWIERENWRKRVSLDECRTAMYEGRVLIATRNPENGDPIGFCFNLSQGEVTSFDINENALKSGFFRDIRTNEVSYVTDSVGMTVFNQGNQLVALWESGDIWLPRTVSLNSVYCESDEYPVTLRVTPKDKDTRTLQITNCRPRHMAATGRAKSIRVRVESGQQVGYLGLATDLKGF